MEAWGGCQETGSKKENSSWTNVGRQNIISKIRKSRTSNIFAAIWIDLEIIILSEVSQTEKDKYHMILLKCRI